MALSAADVYSQRNAGLATVLGSGIAPLRILQQEGYRQYQQHLAAQRLKQQQEAADARTIVPLTANGWLPHNDELSAAVQQGYADMKATYMDSSKTPFERRQFGLQKQAELKALEDRSNEYRDKYKQTVALGSDKRYNKAALEAGAYNSFFRTDPDTGKRTAVPLSEYDASALDNAATNPAYFNRDEVLKQFIKSQADSESVRLGKAAPPGGYGVNRQASSDIFDVNPDGTLAINADGSYKIRDVNALVQRAHADPFMAAILRDNAAKSQDAAGQQSMLNYGQLSPEQNAALQGLQRGPNAEKADLATMLAPYGKTKSSSVQTFRAAPRPRAATGATAFAPVEQVPLNETNLNATMGGEVPGVTPGPGGGIDPGFANVLGVRGQHQQVAALGEFAQPLLVKKSGEKVPVKTDGFAPNEYFREGADGQLQRVKNNKQPMAGIHGPAKGVYVDAKTGNLLPVQTKAEGDALVASGKADLRLGISFYGDKNENFTADKSRIKKELLAQKSDLGQPKYTEVTAEAKAAELASKGVSRNIHLYNDQDARTLNATTGPAYGEYARQLQAEQARLRANYKPATNSGGGIYKRPAAKATPPAPSRGGSIYKTR